MTTEEKAKAYDEALMRTQQRWECGDISREMLEYLFPELQESEDERIRKALIDFIKSQEEDGYMVINNFSTGSILDWLEKQGKQEQVSEFKADDWYVSKVDGKIHNVYANKVEPKFKEGDAVIWDGEEYIIEKVRENTYRVGGYDVPIYRQDEFTLKSPTKFKVGDWVTNGYCKCQISFIDSRYWYSETGVLGNVIDIDKTFHLWTIQDAKEGDILVYGKDKRPFIFKGLLDKFHPTCPVAYCGIDDSNEFLVPLGRGWWTNEETHPSTKEQRNLLFQKMKEAGYEWDEEKKELKKIVQKTADKIEQTFYEGDWIVYKNDICQIVKREEGCNKLITVFGIEKEFVNERNLSTARLWTVSDAKDGDVLAYVTDEEDLWIMLYQSLYEPYEGHVHYHALLVNDNFSDKGTCCICIDNLKPATKEQRDILFKKMHEEGYEWDEDKKELRKINNALEECEIEHIEHGKYYYCIKDYYSGGCKRASKGEVVQALRGLSMMALGVKANEYFIPVKCIVNVSPAWTEEDEKSWLGIIDEIEANKSNAPDYDFETYDRFLSWLKSLKERYTWKPSEEQIRAIRLARSFVVDDFDEHPTLSEILIELEEQLQKIKENKL